MIFLVHNCQKYNSCSDENVFNKNRENCKIVITGDPHQGDIRGNGLVVWSYLESIGIEFDDNDIVRSEIR